MNLQRSCVSGVYDCLVIAGGMGESHIPCAGVLEMIRIVKPGKYTQYVKPGKYTYYVKPGKYTQDVKPGKYTQYVNQVNILRI